MGRQAEGRYVLGPLLGRGGMAEVFAGHSRGDHGFQKPVAIKRLLPELTSDQVFVERLIEEAKLLVNMQHGNIVGVVDLARDGDDVFLVMEFVEGPTLRQLLKGLADRLPFGVTTYIIQSAATGLEFAHARPGGAIIHADISPSNLLLTMSGEVKVADFGIARREGRGVGVIEGKWAYMAPEQARGEALDPRSDVFALGIVLYELLCRTHPAVGHSITPADRASRPLAVVPPHLVDPTIPRGLSDICMRALAHEPRDRYPRMQAVIDDLVTQRFQHGWREGAADLARIIQGNALEPMPARATIITHNPVALMTRSLLAVEPPPDDSAASPLFNSGANTRLYRAQDEPSAASQSASASSFDAPTHLPIEGPPTPAALPIGPPTPAAVPMRSSRPSEPPAIWANAVRLPAFQPPAAAAADLAGIYGGRPPPPEPVVEVRRSRFGLGALALFVIAAGAGAFVVSRMRTSASAEPDSNVVLASSLPTPSDPFRPVEPAPTPPPPSPAETPPVETPAAAPVEPPAPAPVETPRPAETPPPVAAATSEPVKPRPKSSTRGTPARDRDDRDRDRDRDREPTTDRDPPDDPPQRTVDELADDARKLFMAGEFSAAARVYKRAIAIDPSYAPAYRGLGIAYQNLGATSKAIDAFETYLKLRPNAPDASSIRGRLEALQR